ncbi:putative Found in Mitochondrial Proteome [Colletotrichum asianum]
MAAAKRGLSGLQREVLALYRQCLREVRKKPEVRLLFLWQISQPHFRSFARQAPRLLLLNSENPSNPIARNEFDKFLTVDKRDFSVVEHLLRKGRRQLETYSSPSIKDVMSSTGHVNHAFLTHDQSQVLQGHLAGIGPLGSDLAVPFRLKQREIPLSAVQEAASESHRQPAASNAKRFGVADPKLRNAIRRSLSQQSQVSLLASPSRRSSIQSSGPRQPPSRTSSNRRAVDRFTKQLEIYARRREAAGNLPVDTPTPESVVSLHTVDALLPYQDQFLAAGLAVTSDQQRPKREPSVSPAKDKGIETVPDEQAKRPAEIRSKELQSRDNPDHLQFNGQRSPSWDSSYDSSLGTQVAFTQPEAWELAYIDEVPEKKPGCCNLTCFTGREESTEISVNRVPPAQTPTTVDTPNKILDKWHPVYPQKDEVIWIKSPKGIDFRDPRVKTWHGDTAQRPSTYRPARKPQPEDELEATSPTTKRPENQAPEQENVPPIPPRAPGRIKPSVRHQGSTADSATTKGFRKPGQRDVFLDTTDAILVKTKSSTQEPSSTRRSMKPIVESVSDENTHLTEEVPIKTPKETTKAQMSTQEPTRISINQPERKAKEKAARQKQQVEVEHPGNFHSGRMFKSLQEPPKLTEQQPKERSATTSLGTLSPKLDLPSTWKLTLSNPSSLEEAIEQASREMEERDIEETQTAGNNQPVLTEKRQPEAVDLTKTVKELFSRPIDKENAPTAKKLPQKNTESSISTYSSLSTERDDRDIDDRDVLRGLNIAISAACDEEVDAWIRQKTGVRIRRFLADLRAFETLAEEDEADPKHERSRIRRTESRKLQAQIRQSKAAREARAQ